MGRDPRPVADGAIYHLMARGNRRQPIFLDDDDRKMFLRMLSRVCVRYGWTCYGYCLMGNHIHLAIKTPVGNLPEGCGTCWAGMPGCITNPMASPTICFAAATCLC